MCGLVCPSRTSEREGKGILCDRRVARRRGACEESVNPIPNPDSNPKQAPQMSLKEA
jgi:hypothetical protein